jgi:hypothetical protein
MRTLLLAGCQAIRRRGASATDAALPPILTRLV